MKRQILRLYKNDIKKYAGGAAARVSAIYDAIPGQLQKKEKKFVLAALKDDARMREYDSAFFWLEDSKMVTYVLHTKDVEQKDGLVYLPLYMTPLL